MLALALSDLSIGVTSIMMATQQWSGNVHVIATLMWIFEVAKNLNRWMTIHIAFVRALAISTAQNALAFQNKSLRRASIELCISTIVGGGFLFGAFCGIMQFSCSFVCQ